MTTPTEKAAPLTYGDKVKIVLKELQAQMAAGSNPMGIAKGIVFELEAAQPDKKEE
jgi:hypothetical protein